MARGRRRVSGKFFARCKRNKADDPIDPLMSDDKPASTLTTSVVDSGNEDQMDDNPTDQGESLQEEVKGREKDGTNEDEAGDEDRDGGDNGGDNGDGDEDGDEEENEGIKNLKKMNKKR
eukprot:3824245-Ditylum_brightwellii.AAC.2